MARQRLFCLFVLAWLYQCESQTLQLHCDSGWVNIYNRCYLVVPYTHTWPQAKEYCQKYGADLAEPKGYDINSVLYQEAELSGVQQYWIGYNRVGHDTEPSHVGYWSNGDQTGVEVGVWAPYQPDVTGGSCVYVNKPSQDTVNPLWYMSSCQGVYPSICERVPCPTDTNTCSNGRCVGFQAHCNGVNDCGDWSDELDCGCNDLFTSDNGLINVTSDNYKPNMNCLYTISVSIGQRIQVKFDLFDLEDGVDMLEVWDGGPSLTTSSLVTRLTGSDVNGYTTYISSTNTVMLRLLTDSTIQRQGFILQWTTDFTCELRPYPGVAMGADQGGYIKDLTLRQDVSKCVTECDRSATCWGFQYEVLPSGEKQCFIFTEPPVLQPSSCCDIYIKTCSGTTRTTFLDKVPFQATDLVATETWGFLTTPVYPFYYIGNLQLAYTISVTGNQLITLQIVTVDLCCGDTISVYDVVDDTRSLLDTIGHMSKPSYKISRGNTVYIQMDLKQHWTCSGVFIKYKTGCDLQLTSETGEVISPGFSAGSYPPISQCTWTIQPHSGNSVRLSFTDFNTEQDKDFLEIFKGTNDQGEALHTQNGFHGNTAPSTLISSEGLFIRFSTSTLNNMKGFMAVYTSGCPVLTSAAVVLQPSASSYHAPDKVSMTCAEGYLFRGAYSSVSSVGLTCEGDGSWNVSSLPVCERSHCGQPSVLPSGFIESSTGIQGGDLVTYSCNEGFSLQGEPAVQCLSSGDWDQLPTCVSEECDDLSVAYGSDHVTILHGDGIIRGSVVEVTCPQYQQLIGPETVRCVNGMWMSSLPTCQSIPCPEPVIHHANLNWGQSLVVNSIVSVQCQQGYAIGAAMETSGQFLCGVDTAPLCENVDECSQPGAVCFGATCSDTDGGFTCTCLPGYRPVPNSDVQCQDVDECQESLALCDHTCTNTLGSYSCSCNHGYDLYTAAMATEFPLSQGEDGSQPWHAFYVGHSCVLKRCDASVITGINNGGALTSKTVFFAGDQIQYLCDIGYVTRDTNFPSKATVLCQNNSQWDHVPSCSDAFCDEMFSVDVTPQGPIKYLAKYNLLCTQPSGEQLLLERQCGYDTNTEAYVTRGDNLVCPDTDCGIVPIVAGVRPFVTPCTTYDCSVVFECRPQYRRHGSSQDGNFLVRCNEDGVWDFGTMRCEGGQCPDPGRPVDGDTVFPTWDHAGEPVTTVEEGTVVTFTCNTPGYSPTIPSMTCIADGNSMIWDNDLPDCIDVEPPTFYNCPDDMVNEIYSTVVFIVPTVVDNTGVKQLETYPENFTPGSVLGITTSITYVATDYSTNVAFCRFRVLMRDSVPPEITCDLPPTILAAASGVITVDTRNFVSTSDNLAELAYFPSSITVDIDSVGDNRIMTFTATDPSNNIGSCKSQIKIKGPTCAPETLHVYNGNIDCTANQNAGYTCTVTCDQNYVFFEDQTLSQVSLTCDGTDGLWSRNLPICTDTDLSHFKLIPQFQYTLGSTVGASCETVYQNQLRNKVISLTNAFTTLCQGISTPQLDVSPTNGNAAHAELNAAGNRVTARVSIEIKPQGLVDTTYYSCASRINNAFTDETSEVMRLLRTLSAEQNCPSATFLSDTIVISSSSFSCDSAATAVQKTVSTHNCLICPPGTYSNNEDCSPCPEGTYNDQYYQTSCTQCPVETNSKGLGLMYQRQCYDDCGMFLHSTTGKAPCVDCPPNTYWVNSTTCSPCPYNTYTKRRGAQDSSECIGICPKGHFSVDGLLPCTICPRHFYAIGLGSEQCVECQPFEITLQAGSDSVKDCIDGASTLCTPELCKNSGSCLVVRHAAMCSCLPGFTGQFCETAIGPCDVNPCKHGGICTAQSSNTFTCQCQAGYSGPTCQMEENDCEDGACLNNGTCIDKVQSYTCACSSYSGYKGEQCLFPKSPCLVDPCLNNGECIAQGSYFRVCDCTSGFTGINCQMDIDECLSNPCVNGGTCINEANMFRCECPPGYEGTYCHQRSTSGACSPGSCTQGQHCVDDYLSDDMYCTCYNGWTYDVVTRDCARVPASCDQVNCGDHGQCFSYAGGFHSKCKCDQGYGGTSCLTDIDYCAYSPCKNDGTCTDMLETYTCTCTIPETAGQDCSDSVNGCVQCVQENTASCIDILSGYTCYCHNGFTGTNCENSVAACDILPCQHGGTCTVDPSNVLLYTCTCEPHWTGTNCETQVNNCNTQQNTCQNGGTCQSTSDGFICLCDEGHIGPLCQVEYNLCERTQPCVGTSTCSLSSSGPVCDCDTGYTGLSCQERINACTESTCRNGGTCVELDDEVICRCLPGYSGSDCSISACSLQTCPTNSVCRILDATPKCVCNAGKIGENCQKDLSYDFDYLVSDWTSCGRQMPVMLFTLPNPSAISVVFWTRFSILEPDANIVTVYGGITSDVVWTDEWLYKITIASRRVNFQMITVSNVISELLPFENANLVDGFWHHVAVSWSSNTGYLTVYIDGAYSNEMQVAEDEQLVENGYLVLGLAESQTVSFNGRVSHLQVYNNELSDNDVTPMYTNRQVATGGLLELSSGLLDQFSVDFDSELTSDVCTARGSSCTDTAFNASSMPTTDNCPDDLGVVSPRVAMPSWNTATFKNTETSSHITTATSGSTRMGWGVYGVGSAEYDDSHNSAVCVFRLYNKRAACTTLTHTDSSQHTCDTIEGGSRCQITCTYGSTHASTIEMTNYYTCSKYGMWDQSTRLSAFPYPQCASATDPMYNMTFTFQYTMATSTCGNLQTDLTSFTQTVIKRANSETQLQLCRTSTGDSDVTCSAVVIHVDCVANRISLQIRLPFLSSRSSPETALQMALVDDKWFHVEDLVPDRHSLVTLFEPYCARGSQLVNNRCVQCASGFQYNVATSSCDLCPVGRYRTVDSTIDPVSRCTKCPGSETTQEMGSTSSQFCHESCFYGQYLDSSSNNCESCPVGYYGSQLGLIACSACHISLTTTTAGSRSDGLCVDYPVPTTTAPPLLDPSIGASTEDSGLSTGIIVAIILSLLVILIILIVIFLIVTKRLPCFVDDSKVTPTPWKHVNRYGEINIKHVNYRLSDIKESKMKGLDKIPIFQEPVVPDDSISVRTNPSVHVPIFTEKLNGTVHKKHTYISTRQASDVGSEHTLERTLGSEHAPSEAAVTTSTAPLAMYTEEGRLTSSPQHHRRHRRHRKGRRPADLNNVKIYPPRTLSPLEYTLKVPNLSPSSEYVQPLPSFSNQRQPLPRNHYSDFLDHSVVTGTTVTLSNVSVTNSKIVLESDEDDYR